MCVNTPPLARESCVLPDYLLLELSQGPAKGKRTTQGLYSGLGWHSCFWVLVAGERGSLALLHILQVLILQRPKPAPLVVVFSAT